MRLIHCLPQKFDQEAVEQAASKLAERLASQSLTMQARHDGNDPFVILRITRLVRGVDDLAGISPWYRVDIANEAYRRNYSMALIEFINHLLDLDLMDQVIDEKLDRFPREFYGSQPNAPCIYRLDENYCRA
jgi:hypothetical protein